MGASAIATDIELTKARRASFVPPQPLSLRARCGAHAQNTFHSFSSIECHWPPAGSSDPGVLIVSADVPDIRDMDSATASVTLPALPAGTLAEWLSVATPHPPTGVTGHGVLAGAVTWHPQRDAPQAPVGQPRVGHAQQGPAEQPKWVGKMEFSGAVLDVPGLGPGPIALGDMLLRSTPPPAPVKRAHGVQPAVARPRAGFDLLPVALPLGGKLPAILEGHFDSGGYTLHLSGSVIASRLLALSDALPQVGDGLSEMLEPAPAEVDATAKSPAGPPGRSRVSGAPAAPKAAAEEDAPVHIDLTATRAWGGPQVWRETAIPATHPVRRK
jgi:hypothetical protein